MRYAWGNGINKPKNTVIKKISVSAEAKTASVKNQLNYIEMNSGEATEHKAIII